MLTKEKSLANTNSRLQSGLCSVLFKIVTCFLLFCQGTFKDKTATADECGTNVAEQITLHQSADFQSHTAGFEVRASRGIQSAYFLLQLIVVFYRSHKQEPKH